MAERNPDLHKDHRSRLKKRFETEGLDAFEDHNVLEMLLFYSIPRCDTNEIAHELLKEFGSLSSVFDADINALTQVPGIGMESALLIKFVLALWKRYNTDMVSAQKQIRTTKEAVEYLRANFIGKEVEQLIVVMLDGLGNIKRTVLLAEGSKDGVELNMNKLLRELLNTQAMGVVIAHSHPQCFAIPSAPDTKTTERLIRVLGERGIAFCDHIIFSKDDYFSFAQSPSSGILRNALVFKDV